MKDYIIRGMAANNQISVFSVTNKQTIEKARQLHQTSPVATAALGRLMTAAAMMGTQLKGEGDLLTLQIKGSGPIQGIVVTTNAKAEVKGYVYNPDVDIPLNQAGKLDVSEALGLGIMSIIKDIGLKNPYIGQTHLVTGEIAEDLTYYFATSEQVPSVVALGVLIDRDGSVKQSGGFILQLLPNAEEYLIEKLEGNLTKMPSVTTLLEKGYTPEDMIQLVLGDLEFTVHEKLETKFSCNCTKERVEKALISVGRKDIQEMIDDGNLIELNCHFCSKKYNFTPAELEDILRKS
ncbi:MAG: Hsp33 family molecular chaperone HslO [Firmicutes bacterium HGW-Firmicutes-7]|nr:MAG: Hsp33 family molecular chaperone HslO [Firmicutes bacterium HGW-Firmicutes-7]